MYQDQTPSPRPNNRMIRLIVMALVVVGVIAWWQAAQNQPAIHLPRVVTSAVTNDQPGLYQVTHVDDGDTIVVAQGGVTETVRLIGMDTPEVKDPRKPVQCYGA